MEPAGDAMREVSVGGLVVHAAYRNGQLRELRIVGDGPIRGQDIAAIPLVQMEASVRFGAPMPTEPIDPARLAVTRPDGTERWRRDFAQTYMTAAVHTAKPARAIAEASGLPISAVHRWAREASLRSDLTWSGAVGPWREQTGTWADLKDGT